MIIFGFVVLAAVVVAASDVVAVVKDVVAVVVVVKVVAVVVVAVEPDTLQTLNKGWGKKLSRLKNNGSLFFASRQR